MNHIIIQPIQSKLCFDAVELLASAHLGISRVRMRSHNIAPVN
ncbi:hypothetical protein M8C21_005297 [Ambrosia artemisiifolia]|uniref:Uncharacterized protein n=1 Tax=Ambrosia artemisiifolia TaxID=4212 RepID=A0AAD5CR55_AMBAR|nr:hypothetical protein M8C21_005297 [Ambrosia artemisiifolia]